MGVMVGLFCKSSQNGGRPINSRMLLNTLVLQIQVPGRGVATRKLPKFLASEREASCTLLQAGVAVAQNRFGMLQETLGRSLLLGPKSSCTPLRTTVRKVTYFPSPSPRHFELHL